MDMVTAFCGDSIVARGGRDEVADAVKRRFAAGDLASVRIFEDSSGRVVDLDYRSAPPPAGDAAARGRGRPRLGVTAREVTLLPRHWEWLAGQPGGASAALRRLVEEARRAPSPAAGSRERRDCAYRVMSALCGDRPGYEEALRALYRGDEARFAEIVAGWPGDIRAYLGELLAG